jgi:hypothetical protein
VSDHVACFPSAAGQVPQNSNRFPVGGSFLRLFVADISKRPAASTFLARHEARNLRRRPRTDGRRRGPQSAYVLALSSSKAIAACDPRARRSCGSRRHPSRPDASECRPVASSFWHTCHECPLLESVASETPSPNHAPSYTVPCPLVPPSHVARQPASAPTPGAFKERG